VSTAARDSVHRHEGAGSPVNKKGGKITFTQTFVVSSDGKTRTITGTGTNALGQTVNRVTV
jgi:hypothetical protein